MKKIVTTFFAAVFSIALMANPVPDEGMWLPMFIKDYNYADMQKLGLKLTPEQMYDINNSSLKDAIVQLGNFCTGEMISKDGLMITNHHCGYSSIADHSTEEHDYLKYGFWAMNKSEELPNPGLTVTFLVRMDDVTKIVLEGVDKNTSESKRKEMVEKAAKKLKDENSEDGKYSVIVRPFYEGNEYYMFVYEVYKDVRLVGAPPSSIGKFGGDTDNWMWPRHTGDFTMFRVYTAPDGTPAEYSPDNIPLKPKHHLPISLKGIEENDYAMIWGFPGRTNRFMTSHEVRNTTNLMNPALVEACDVMLPIIRDAMNASDKVRIDYSDHFASLANMWKNKQGETASLLNLKVAERKEKQEEAIVKWVNQNTARKEQYGDFMSDIKNAIDKVDANAIRAFWYSNMAYRSATMMALPRYLGEANPGDEKNATISDEKKTKLLGFYQQIAGSLDQGVEAKLIEASFQLWEKLPEGNRPDLSFLKKYKNDPAIFAKACVEKSIFGSKENFEKYLNKPSKKTFTEDPLVHYSNLVFGLLFKSQGAYLNVNKSLEIPRRSFIAAIKEMEGSKPMYPDANSTMRMTYGKVIDYYPVDGVHYLHYTTEKGILEKEIPGDPEFDVPAKLKELIEKKDFGKYGKNGMLPVCFLTDNDITGGNSGSPVINANGEMIGIAFDGNWEALSSDIVFNTELQRCINVDIRYVMFVIDKFAGAGYLLDEMTIIQ
ncbi:S46 family peptidase [Bacteroidales bacterium OttesenSCG-928-B11]|nr:S46 family peptidase [Bacteroidales bacterium OttesenSCG-928-B11]MDL2325791.1 S46 family peptidase [Bacteroidales bacterium OttesenSCG-928-A14]